MSRELLLVSVLVLLFAFCALASQPAGSQMKAFQMAEDFGGDQLSECFLQYYYYIPCPTYSWLWAYSGPITPEAVGVFFEVGDISMGTGTACDPAACHTLETVRIMDFAGYGTLYPGLFTIEMNVYCSDERGCPLGSALWTSGPLETHFAWNYINIEPPLCLTPCSTSVGPPPLAPRILVTATHTGINGIYPAWGLDNISTALEQGCVMHDISSLPAVYPRPTVSHYPRIHTGFYGVNFEYCPPLWFPDGRDTTDDCSQFGYIELLWRIYLSCTGPTAGDPSTWSNIKAMYR